MITVLINNYIYMHFIQQLNNVTIKSKHCYIKLYLTYSFYQHVNMYGKWRRTLKIIKRASPLSVFLTPAVYSSMSSDSYRKARVKQRVV